jgi:hypothetical protein
VVTVVAPVTSIQSSGDIAVLAETKQETIAQPSTNESGPRLAGARRSTERIRKKTTSKPSSSDTTLPDTDTE